MVATGLYQYSLLDVIDIADIVDRDPAEVADTYFALMDYLGTDGLLTAVSRLARDDRWHSLARLAIRDDIYASLRSLCFDVLAVGEHPHVVVYSLDVDFGLIDVDEATPEDRPEDGRLGRGVVVGQVLHEPDDRGGTQSDTE